MAHAMANATEQEREEWDTHARKRIDEWTRLEERFAALWGISSAAADMRHAREVMMDGDLVAIPAAHRLAVVRQLFIVLGEHGLIDHDVDESDAHLRAVAARMGLPYLELLQAFKAEIINPETTRDDLDDWHRWCAENMPQRLEVGK